MVIILSSKVVPGTISSMSMYSRCQARLVCKTHALPSCAELAERSAVQHTFVHQTHRYQYEQKLRAYP